MSRDRSASPCGDDPTCGCTIDSGWKEACGPRVWRCRRALWAQSYELGACGTPDSGRRRQSGERSAPSARELDVGSRTYPCPKGRMACQANIRVFHIKLSQSSNTAMISSPSISPVSVKRNELYK